MEETKKMKIGDPLDRSTQHGPQNHLAHLNKLIEYCETAEKEVRINILVFIRLKGSLFEKKICVSPLSF